MLIYEIVNRTTGKKYIGQTVADTLIERWTTHKSKLNNNKHHNKLLQSDWNINCEFECNIIKDNILTTEALDAWEQYYIDLYGTLTDGYNLTPGGQQNGRGFAYCKTWNGLISPDGKQYDNIRNLAQFARDHGLQEKVLRKLAHGLMASYKGWTLIGRTNQHTYEKLAYWKGKKASQKTKNKHRENMINRWKSPEFKKQQSERMISYWKSRKNISLLETK